MAAIPLSPLRARSRDTIVVRMLALRNALVDRMVPVLRLFFQRQEERVLARLLAAEKSMKDIVPLAEDLMPVEEDTLLKIAIQPYVDAGILTSAELAALLLAAESMPSSSPEIQRLLAQSGDRIVKINRTTREAIRDALQEAQLQGLNLYQIANGTDKFRGLRDIVRQTYRGRAEAIARTEQAWASQRANHAQWMELGVQYVDIVDGDRDEPCARRNNTRIPVTDIEGADPLHPNCLIGESLVLAPNLQALTSRWFEGEVIILRTAQGDLLTCTPNHPILTPHGWVAAGCLDEGSDVVRCTAAVEISKRLDPHNEHVPARIKEMSSSPMMAISLSLRGVPVAAMDFHGDGGGSTEVDVVWATGFLGDRDDAVLSHLSLVGSGQVLSAGIDQLAAGQSDRFSSRSHRETIAVESEAQGLGVDSCLFADLGNAHPGLVEAVRLCEIRRGMFRGHVYTLQTQQGWFIAENIITRNCTVLSIPVVG